MDTKKLRQKILDLAIRGKLVPQDPNDEPASVLLERIRAEKQQLIKEGKIKASKGSKACDMSHYENYNLPPGWVWAQMKDICTKIVDGDHNPPKGQTTPTDYIMISSKNINNHSLCSLNEVRYLSAKQFCGANERTNATPGDIFMTSVASLGRTVIYDGSLNISFQRSITVISTLVNNRYLQLFIDSPLYQKHIDTNAKGTAQRGFYLNQVEDSWVPVPPYAEQEKICDSAHTLLDMVDGIEGCSGNLMGYIDKVKSKVLALAISGKLIPQDPSDEPAIELLKRINPDFKPCDNSHYEDLPISWSICTLYDICDTINGLWKGKNPPFVNVGVIRNANFTKDFNLDYSKIEYIDVEQRAFDKRNLEDGDLIVEKSGGSDNFPVGRSILYQGESGKYSFSNFTMALRIKDKNLIRSRYLYFVILHKYLSGEMRQMQTQTTGLHNLLSDKYMSMPIPIPPTKEQDRIIDSIEKLLNQMNKIKTVL